jgi:hypothetical protein
VAWWEEMYPQPAELIRFCVICIIYSFILKKACRVDKILHAKYANYVDKLVFMCIIGWVAISVVEGVRALKKNLGG